MARNRSVAGATFAIAYLIVTGWVAYQVVGLFSLVVAPALTLAIASPKYRNGPWIWEK